MNVSDLIADTMLKIQYVAMQQDGPDDDYWKTALGILALHGSNFISIDRDIPSGALDPYLTLVCFTVLFPLVVHNIYCPHQNA